MNRSRFTIVTLLVVLMVGLCAPPPAEAGLMDSIGGFFKKASDTVKGWFSGGGEKEFKALLDKVEQSQSSVAEVQNGILDVVTSQGQNSVRTDSAQWQEGMNQLSSVSTQNEQLFTELLKVRQELVSAKKDVSSYQDQLTRIQSTQHNLEEGYQAIQDVNRAQGGLTPPAQVAAAAAAAKGSIWNDPKAQQYMDEWNAGVGLDEWGRNVRASNIMAYDDPEHGQKSKHEWLWEHRADTTGGSNITMRNYVMARLNGENPRIIPPEPAAIVSKPPPPASTGGGTIDRPTSTKASVTSQSLAAVERDLKEAMKDYQDLAEAGEDQSEEGKLLLEVIRDLNTERDLMIKRGVSASGH